MRPGLTAILLWILFLAYEATIRGYDLYRLAPPVDLGGHFLSGAALAATLLALLPTLDRWFRRRGGRRATAVLWAVAISLLWEVGEIVEERIRFNPPHLRDPFLWDGVSDVAVAALGAAVAAWLLERGHRRG